MSYAAIYLAMAVSIQKAFATLGTAHILIYFLMAHIILYFIIVTSVTYKLYLNVLYSVNKHPID